MTPTRAQLDAAEAWLLQEWRVRASEQRLEGAGRVEFGSRDRDAWLEARSELATAIRAIRAMRKALVCVMCGETIRPGTMNGYECSLTREGWLCGALSHTKHAVGDEP